MFSVLPLSFTAPLALAALALQPHAPDRAAHLSRIESFLQTAPEAEIVWISDSLGISDDGAFQARLKQIAHERGTGWQGPSIDLFHPTADFSAAAIAKLTADAQQAGARLHVLHDARHGRLNGERIRAEVPDWREASIWFCGPARFGESLRHDFAAQGFPVKEHFHQELFAMR